MPGTPDTMSVCVPSSSTRYCSHRAWAISNERRHDSGKFEGSFHSKDSQNLYSPVSARPFATEKQETGSRSEKTSLIVLSSKTPWCPYLGGGAGCARSLLASMDRAAGMAP